MKHLKQKSFKKRPRGLLALTSFLFVLNLLLVSFSIAFAEEAPAVKVRIETPNRSIWEGPVEVDGCTVKDDIGKEYSFEGPKAACALVEAAKEGNFKYSFNNTSWGLFLSSIDGVPLPDDLINFWLYFVNYKAGEVGLTQKDLNEGDELLLLLSAWPPPPLLKAEASKYLVEPGESFTITSRSYDETTEKFVPVSSAQVHLGEKIYQTNEEGVLTLSFDESGNYKIYLEKEGYFRSGTLEIRAVKPEVQRLGGNTSPETAIAISQKGWPNGSKVAIVARDDYFTDALAGAPLAKYLAYKFDTQAPILLTDPATLNEKTKEEIKRLGAENVYILGGEGALSLQVEDALKAISGVNVVRLWGYTSYGTALAIKAEMVRIAGEQGYPEPRTAIIVTGESFSDSLVISGPAASKNMPILLVKPFVQEPSTETKLALQGIKDVIIVGGPGAVHPDLEAWLRSNEYNVITRLWGLSEYDTAIDVASSGDFLFDFDDSTALVTRGDYFTDALAGGAFASQLGLAPMVLVSPDFMPEITNLWFLGVKEEIKTVYVLGGRGAVSDAVMGRVEGMIK